MYDGIVLNTRPISQSSQTRDAFNAHGFEVVDFPCIEIVQPSNIKKRQKQLNGIDPTAIIIFTSPQAVIYAFKIKPDWKIPRSAIVIAVGTKTAEYLEQYTDNNIFVPELQNSQGVIDILDGLKTIQSIALISAKNGRQEIQKYAKENNILLSQINVYKRQVPTMKMPLEWIKKDKLEICILATSITILDNLKLLLDKRDWKKLQSQLVICASSRIENHALKMGCINTLNAMSANPTVMAEKLSHF